MKTKKTIASPLTCMNLSVSRNVLTILAPLTLILAGNAEAVLIAYDGFDYAAGANLVGQSGGTGWDGSWAASNSVRLKINDGGLSYLGLVVSGNAVNNTSGSGVSGRRDFDLAPTSGSVFFSFLVAGNETTRGRYGASLRPADATAGPGAVGQGNDQFLNGEDGFQFRPNQTELGFNSSNVGGTSINGTNLLVVQYNYDTNLASYWANPTELGGIAPAATISGISFTDPNDADPGKLVNQFFFAFQDASLQEGLIFDEFRVGTTYGSVTPVPEPSSALMFLGTTGLLAFRRRRSGK